MDGIGQPEKVGVRGQFQPVGGMAFRPREALAGPEVIEHTAVDILEIEYRTDVLVGIGDGEMVGTPECGDFIPIEADAPWVGDFVAVVARPVGHVLEAPVKGEGMVGCHARKIELPRCPPLLSQMEPLAQGVGIACRQHLSPPGIDFLVRHPRLVVERDAVFHQLVIPFAELDVVILCLDRGKPERVVLEEHGI